MILAPGDFITSYCDGVIFSSSNMIKLSAKETWGAVVNFTVLGDKHPDKSFEFDDIASFLVNYGSDALKVGYNVKILPIINLFKLIMGKDKKSDQDISGQYPDQKQEGAALYSWWEGVLEEFKGATQEKLKEMHETNKVQKELQQKYLRKEQMNKIKVIVLSNIALLVCYSLFCFLVDKLIGHNYAIRDRLDSLKKNEKIADYENFFWEYDSKNIASFDIKFSNGKIGNFNYAKLVDGKIVFETMSDYDGYVIYGYKIQKQTKFICK